MFHKHSLINRLAIPVLNDKVYQKIQKGNDVIFDVITPNDTRKLTYPLNAVQHTFLMILFLLVSYNGNKISIFLALL